MPSGVTIQPQWWWGVGRRVPFLVVYWFLFRPKWLLFLAGCLAVAVLFVNLGL